MELGAVVEAQNYVENEHKHHDGDDVFNLIHNTIQVEDMVAGHFSWEKKDSGNGKVNFCDDKPGRKGCFVDTKKNILVNTGTHHFTGDHSPYTFVRDILGLEGRAIFEYFGELSPVIKAELEKQNKQKTNRNEFAEKDSTGADQDDNEECDVRIKADGDSKNESQADKIVALVNANPNIKLFRDELDKIYVQFPVPGHLEVRPCRHSLFKKWLSNSYWEEYEKVPNNESVSNALNVLEGRCHANGNSFDLFNRVAFKDEVLWYDLSNNDWEAVKITQKGWEVVSTPPILFRRQSHQKGQITPTAVGDVKKFLEFVNIQEEDQKILVLVLLVSCFIPDFPHPIPIVHGAQGSAKSTLSKLLRRIIDPSKVEVLGFPQSIKELVQHLSHHWCAVYDNASPIKPWISDELCKVVTGGGFSKRELYSDDEDIIYQMQRCLIINGINLVATKPDLLERAILFKLDRVPREKRRSEKMLLSDFDAALPGILGGVFDILAEVLRIRPDIIVESPSRMADFCEWGSAIAVALGYSQEKFLSAYDRNLNAQNKEVLYSDPVALVVIAFMENQSEWSGEPTDLLNELKILAEGMNIDTRDSSFPKNSTWLMRRLNQIETNLSEVGISILRQDGMRRIITFRKTDENSVSAVNRDGGEQLSLEVQDAKDGKLQTPTEEGGTEVVTRTPRRGFYGAGSVDPKFGEGPTTMNF